ncbi:HdeD family acid-resistance protein [Microvirga sp. P5_D2]|jgi:uncharacterized membrane protein HdeD (DUF308 family)
MATVLRTDLGVSAISRGWLLGVGALAVVLGVIGLFMTLTFVIVDVAWYGALLIVAGAIQAIEVIALPVTAGSRLSRALCLMLGLLYVAAGLYAVFQPAGAGVALTLVLGALLVASGAVRAAWMLAREGQHARGLGLVLAVVSAALGLLLLGQWPVSGLWVLGLFVSADLVAYGLSWCWAVYAAHRIA